MASSLVVEGRLRTLLKLVPGNHQCSSICAEEGGFTEVEGPYTFFRTLWTFCMLFLSVKPWILSRSRR